MTITSQNHNANAINENYNAKSLKEREIILMECFDILKEKLPSMEMRQDEPMKNHTTFKIGGPVRLMCFPESAEDLQTVCDVLCEQNITPFILGNGSNILASDEPLDLVVINTSKLDSISIINDMENFCDVKAYSGTLLSKLAVFAYEHGLSGLEFSHGIPGSVGGAVVMNAGAYGEEMKDVIIETEAYSKADGLKVLTAADNNFSYRHSRFSDSNEIVVSAVMRLKKGDKKSIKDKMDELSTRRKESQPLNIPSGGSTFKRPKEGYAAALIENAGLKGYTVGDAMVSEKHSGFVVNNGNATFADVISVVEHVQKVISEKNKFRLETEIKIVR